MPPSRLYPLVCGRRGSITTTSPGSTATATGTPPSSGHTKSPPLLSRPTVRATPMMRRYLLPAAQSGSWSTCGSSAVSAFSSGSWRTICGSHASPSRSSSGRWSSSATISASHFRCGNQCAFHSHVPSSSGGSPRRATSRWMCRSAAWTASCGTRPRSTSYPAVASCDAVGCVPVSANAGRLLLDELDDGDAAVAVTELELDEPAVGREPHRPRAAPEREPGLAHRRPHRERVELPCGNDDVAHAEHGRGARDAVHRPVAPGGRRGPGVPRRRVGRQERIEPEGHQVERRMEVTTLRRRKRLRPERGKLRERGRARRPPDVRETVGAERETVRGGGLDRARDALDSDPRRPVHDLLDLELLHSGLREVPLVRPPQCSLQALAER